VLANQREISVDEAFSLLRKHSRDRNTRIHEVARGVISGDLRLPEPPTSPGGK
jgi:AmiR/NasT family two-component response regulator